MKRWLMVLLAGLIILSRIAAGGSAEKESSSAADGEKQVKAVVLLEGPLADTGWNSSSWEALQGLGDKYGWDVSYQDNVSTDNMIALLRGYGQQNFDLVFGPGWLWAEPMTAIAPEFPDTTWINLNQSVSGSPNLSSNLWIVGEGGYFLGLLAAHMTETKKIAKIGGTESPFIAYEYEQMKKIAKEVDPEIEYSISYVGSWSDAAKAKELARAAIEMGADIILSVSGGADLGVHEAVREADRKVMYMGWTADNRQWLPDHTIGSWVALPGDLLRLAGEEYAAGTLKAGPTVYDMSDGAHYLVLSEKNVPEDVQKIVNDAIREYSNGKLSIETVDGF